MLSSAFVSVDDKRELFNPDCRNCLLLNNIKERCDCDDEGNPWRVLVSLVRGLSVYVPWVLELRSNIVYKISGAESKV